MSVLTKELSMSLELRGEAQARNINFGVIAVKQHQKPWDWIRTSKETHMNGDVLQ